VATHLRPWFLNLKSGRSAVRPWPEPPETATPKWHTIGHVLRPLPTDILMAAWAALVDPVA
jgi:hypothetical protein